ncbi:LOW QUALITY PROTEIN: proprotein convertase subtilisin/kexin type 1 inhibitor, like [Trematomus bernacchii]|uniref:LOW QUALITY PROTEIN: proprotein convertase subtilisin/kexin type 1 inhibitor, like n=1 Tax=Trematomus bernacchii TaxID=40690 RepID=UPI00146F9338|nr:LOW QUALITY PROTEIN: proprotein convertase subtilisin/kexin type 1 inhibitor, like [Trematomus bernacchii]
MSRCVLASLSLLLLCTALIHAAQALPIGRGGGRGLDTSVGGVRRQRRDLVLPYEDRIMSYPATQGGGRASSLYYQSDDIRGRGLDEALQRLVERDQRREQEEEQRAAYLSALLRLLSEAESAGLVGPGDLEVEEEEEEEEGAEPQGDFLSDYDESGLRMRRPAWWGVLEPQLAQALMDRMDPQLAQALLQGNRSERPRQAGRGTAGDQDTLRRKVARLLSSDGPSDGRRGRRDLSSGPAHRRARRSLDDMAPPSPSNDPPLLRVKRLDEEELRPPAGLQRMKRIDAMATEELHHGSRSRRRRRAAQDYDPQILMDQILEYMRE